MYNLPEKSLISHQNMILLPILNVSTFQIVNLNYVELCEYDKCIVINCLALIWIK